MAYIDLKLLKEKLRKKLADFSSDYSLNKKIKKAEAFAEMCDAIQECPKIDIVQCEDCDYAYIEGNKIYCRNTVAPWHNDEFEILTQKTDFCSYGKLKTTKQTTCKDCKYLMFSDCYGECSKQLRIVDSKDTCQYAEPRTPKERR